MIDVWKKRRYQKNENAAYEMHAIIASSTRRILAELKETALGRTVCRRVMYDVTMSLSRPDGG